MKIAKQAEKLYQEGYTMQEIALQLNIHEDEVGKLLPLNATLTEGVENIVTIYNDNPDKSAKDLAAEMGISYQYIARCLKNAGIDVSVRTEELRLKQKEEMKKRIREMYAENVALTDMCAELGISSTTLREYAKELGLTLRTMRSKRRREQIDYLLTRRLEGASYQDIANELEISYQYAINLASYARSKGIPVPNQRDKKEKENIESTESVD